ncbi:MAG: 30S ribosomal protein S6 [Armatimonadetes bacterium]|nr:30S ribosomal protein S6 [Armatimonadota bacterium]
MRHYEAMFLVDANTTDEALEAIIEKYKNVVTETGGVVGEAGKWENGSRRLAYELAGRQEAIYVLMNFEAGADTPSELDRMFRISDDVFRHIIVRRDQREE